VIVAEVEAEAITAAANAAEADGRDLSICQLLDNIKEQWIYEQEQQEKL